ncbi:hypothetical protein ABBQ32_005058 [Trebouxia sp. C0010 RCD-2024]
MGNALTAFGSQARQQKASDFLDEKLAELLKKRAARSQVKAASFNKLLLRFGDLNKGFAKCKTVYHSLDIDGNEVIDLQELAEGCNKLGFNIGSDVIDRVFQATDLDGNKVIDFREFIVVLALLYMISTEENNNTTQLDPDIIRSFNIAQETFCFFDSSGDGYMDRTEVTGVLLEGNKGGRELEGVAMKNTIARRFEELDWDNNGQISFKEFLYAVQGWVLDEDEYEAMPDEDQKEKLAAKSAAAQRLRATSSNVAAIKMDARSLHSMSMKSSMKKP